jgi:hypothetical protein
MAKGSSKKKAEPKEPKPWIAVTSKKHDEAAKNLSDAGQAKYHGFIGKINEGKHPKTAAEETGDMHYTRLNGKVSLDEVRLDGSERLTGREGEEWTHPETGKKYRTWHVQDVGGHTK